MVFALRQRLGANLRRLRMERHINQGTLATLAGLTQSLVSRVEGGHSRLTDADSHAIANALGISDAALASELRAPMPCPTCGHATGATP